MKSVEDTTKELDEITKESFEKAQELSNILKKYNDIDLELGDEPTEEETEKAKAFWTSVDVRRQGVFRRLLVEWGGVLFL